MVTFIKLAMLAAVTWFPAADWTDTPDPIASPRAKKGGTVRFNGSQSPKSLNGYVDSNTYTRMTFSLMYEQLISVDTETLDFVPWLAKRWAVSDDGMEFTFVLDENARWSDGVKVDAYDVKWTFDAVVKPGNDTSSWKVILGTFESPEVIDERTIRFRKKPGHAKDWRDLINCGMFWILPRHAFEGKDFNKLDMVDAPVSGPYRISRVAEQIETEFARVGNWWRRELPSCRYVYNFDRILMRYYVDNENAFEALKKRTIDVYPVYTARIMSAETHGEKFDRNWLLKRRVKNHEPLGFQGFAMNMRRFPFDDRRVREAMAMLIDRETMNRTMMFNEYFLLNSTVTDLWDREHPCPNRFFKYDVAGAQKLLAEAGWKRDEKTGELMKDGRPFHFTFLSRSGTEDKFLALFDHALRQCGIKMDIARKDFAGWMRDMDGFNYDMTWASWGASIFRTPETMWISSEADRLGSNNMNGFKSAELDKLIGAEKSMQTMAERTAAYREMDRIICAESPYAFLWHVDETRLIYWNKFGMPDVVLGKFNNEESIFTYWWYDEDRAEELKRAMENHTCLPNVPERVVYDDIMTGKK